MSNTSVRQPTITISPLLPEKLQLWMDANAETRGDSEIPRLSRFWDDSRHGVRTILTAWDGDVFQGHITVQPVSEFQPFRAYKIPEIVDLWVQPAHRNGGVATALLRAAEETVRAAGAKKIGLGVGVTRDFGAAHRLYATNGFIPDGSGMWAHGARTETGDTITVDDGVLLMWVKGI